AVVRLVLDHDVVDAGASADPSEGEAVDLLRLWNGYDDVATELDAHVRHRAAVVILVVAAVASALVGHTLVYADGGGLVHSCRSDRGVAEENDAAPGRVAELVVFRREENRSVSRPHGVDLR